MTEKLIVESTQDEKKLISTEAYEFNVDGSEVFIYEIRNGSAAEDFGVIIPKRVWEIAIPWVTEQLKKG